MLRLAHASLQHVAATVPDEIQTTAQLSNLEAMIWQFEARIQLNAIVAERRPATLFVEPTNYQEWLDLELHERKELKARMSTVQLEHLHRAKLEHYGIKDDDP